MPNKRVLFIAPSFFNYAQLIIDEMIKQGYRVDFYDERPSKSTLMKALIRINQNYVKWSIKAYFNKILEETAKTEYDIVFIIKCESFSKSMLEQLRSKQHKARFVLYLWDSIANYPQIVSILPCFDRVLSFDSVDCNNYDGLEFLPLFYSGEYEKIGTKSINKDYNYAYDVLFVGTAHPKRYQFLMELKTYFIQKNIRYYYFMYLPSKLLYLYRRFVEQDYKYTKLNDFHYKSLNEDQVLKYFTESKVIIDFQHHLQSGLTMRTMECLGARKKMITSNSHIREYDFFNPNNICVIEGDLDGLDEKFINSNYIDVEDEIYEKYSVATWVKHILCDNY